MQPSRHYILFLIPLLTFNIGYSQPKLKAIYIDGKRLNTVSTNIKIAALEDDISLEFEVSEKDSVTYQFKLDNYDLSWIKSNYPTIRYTNLKGGNYTLKWKASYNKSETPEASLTLIIEPSLSEEWWFIPSIIFYIVLIISVAIYFFLLYNLRQKVKIQSIRNRIAADLHDEVGSTLNSIAIFSRLAEKKLDKKNSEVLVLLDKIKTDSEETVNTIRDTVWAINPDNDSISQLFEKMRSVAFQFLTANDITLDFQNKVETDKNLKINMEQRRNVYLIFKEAINNIVKHAEATFVKVEINKKDDDIFLSIEDNGKGFDNTEVYEGNGVKNYKKRADEGFLSVSIQSKIGQGTKIEVLIPEI